MRFSLLAMDHCAPVLQSILRHPFNVKMGIGTLPMDLFQFYLAQDSRYLETFARALALASVKGPTSHTSTLLGMAQKSVVDEQKLVRRLFTKVHGETPRTPALVSYEGHLLRHTSLDPYPIGLASLVPCFNVYERLGKAMQPHSPPGNCYAPWIATYSSSEFMEASRRISSLLDEAAAASSDATQRTMLQVYETSVHHEWRFWDDAYHRRVFAQCPRGGG